MTSPPRPSHESLFKSAHIATLVVVGVAFTISYVEFFANRQSAAGPPFSAATLVIATLLGVAYLVLLIAEERFDLFHTSRSKTIYFLTLTALVLAIEFLLAGAGAIWLISMPLIAEVATDVKSPLRWLIYIVLFIGVILPLYLLTGVWQTTIYVTLTYVTAFVFVFAFARVNRVAENAQHKAEKLAAELADANHRLGDYAVQAEELATMHERNRLAREIHDNLGHYLTIVNVQIKAAQALIPHDPERAMTALDKAAQSTQEGLSAVRQSVSAIRESPLGRQTLQEAIAKLTGELNASGIVAEFRMEGEPRPLDARAELTIFRAAQEGLTNIRKHARASRVDMMLRYAADATTLVIHDNGVGASEAHASAGFGLLGLQERARQLGGNLRTTSAPGEGYTLALELPADVAPVAAEEG